MANFCHKKDHRSYKKISTPLSSVDRASDSRNRGPRIKIHTTHLTGARSHLTILIRSMSGDLNSLERGKYSMTTLFFLLCLTRSKWNPQIHQHVRHPLLLGGQFWRRRQSAIPDRLDLLQQPHHGRGQEKRVLVLLQAHLDAWRQIKDQNRGRIRLPSFDHRNSQLLRRQRQLPGLRRRSEVAAHRVKRPVDHFRNSRANQRADPRPEAKGEHACGGFCSRIVALPGRIMANVLCSRRQPRRCCGYQGCAY